MQTEYSALGYRVAIYFYDCSIAIEVDEFRHQDRDIYYEIERQEAIMKKLGCILLELILIKKIAKSLMPWKKCTDILKNHLKNL